MIIGLLLGLLAAWAMGRCVVQAGWPPTTGSRAESVFRHSLALALGLGLSSCLLFLWLVVLGWLDATLVIVELLVVIGLGAAWRARRPKQPVVNGRFQWFTPPQPGREMMLFLMFGAALATFVITHAVLASKSPHGGGFDTWIIWNLRARFLYRGGEEWLRGFSPDIAWSHPDYPLLVPASVARLWQYGGGESTLAPCLLATLFTLATVGLLVTGLTHLRGREQGLLGGTVLLAAPFYLTHSASQYGDGPLSLFLLATLVLLAWQSSQSPGHPGLLLLAGLTAGCAGWTKNEGLLVLAVTGGWLCLSAWRSGGLQMALRHGGFFAAGLAPVLVCLLLFKGFIAPPNDLAAGQSFSETLGRLTDPQRYLTVLRWFVERIILFDSRGWVHVVPALAIYLALQRPEVNATQRQAVQLCAAILGTMLLGYAAVYVATPNLLEWHLQTSLDRLLFQLWPGTVFLAFLVIRPPGATKSSQS